VTVLAGAATGGSIFAEVIGEPGGWPTKKHLGPPQYESLALPVGLVMSNALFDWLADSWGPTPPVKDGAVLALDYQLEVKTEAEFTGSLITETGFPALDAASKATGQVTVRVQPTSVDLGPGSGKLPITASKQKLWRLSNFRLEIDGLDCTHVSRIEAFEIRREVEIEPSSTGPPSLVPGKVEFPNLRVTLSQTTAQTWYAWHQQFVVEQNNGEEFERAGRLRFLAVDLKTELTRIEFSQLGIVKVAPAPDQPGRITAELYCEQMTLAEPGGPQ
jgi:hypothetical protein